jgi:hypothetical protein
MFSKKLKPIFVSKKNLIRLGPKRDGGYVIDKRIIKKINHIVTCGLSDDWNFERDFLKYNNNINISAYDHTVNSSFWINRFFKDIIHFFLLKKLSFWKIKNIFKYFDYVLFFKKKNKHFQIKVGNKNLNNREITINKILNNKMNVLLKVDIEGGEYGVLKDIKINYKRINCLIIEFHSVKKNMKKINNFINQNKDLEIIHIHGNNVNKLDKYGLPYSIEITFIKTKLFKFHKQKNNNDYPIENLDYPSVKRNEDIKLKFI